MPVNDNGNPRTRKALSARVKRNLALDLKLRGLSHRQIAGTYVDSSGKVTTREDPDGRVLYKSPASVTEALDVAYKELRRDANESAHDARTLDLQRIDRLIAALWPAAIGGRVSGVTVPPDTDAIAQIRPLLDRRAKILGLDFKDGLDERAVRVQELQVEKWDKALTKAMTDAGLTSRVADEVRAALARHLQGATS